MNWHVWVRAVLGQGAWFSRSSWCCSPLPFRAVLAFLLSVINFSILIFHFFFRSCFRFSGMSFQFSVFLCVPIFSFFIFQSIDNYLDQLLRLMLRWLSISFPDFPFVIFSICSCSSFPIFEFSLCFHSDGRIYHFVHNALAPKIQSLRHLFGIDASMWKVCWHEEWFISVTRPCSYFAAYCIDFRNPTSRVSSTLVNTRVYLLFCLHCCNSGR